MKKISLCTLLFLVFCPVSMAGTAHVLNVDITPAGDGVYDLSVTVQHDDDGWEHYADRWEILDPEGNVLATRVLLHPHTKEPFTRSLTGVSLPAGITEVIVRAHDKVHGYGGRELKISLPAPKK